MNKKYLLYFELETFFLTTTIFYYSSMFLINNQIGWDVGRGREVEEDEMGGGEGRREGRGGGERRRGRIWVVKIREVEKF